MKTFIKILLNTILPLIIGIMISRVITTLSLTINMWQTWTIVISVISIFIIGFMLGIIVERDKR